MARRRSTAMTQVEKVGLTSRLEELELRLKLLEARVRKVTAPQKAKTAPQRRRPESGKGHRCPGCTLELPQGKRGEVCVWCGFRFDGVALLDSARRAAR
jgi:hypothetical protein